MGGLGSGRWKFSLVDMVQLHWQNKVKSGGGSCRRSAGQSALQADWLQVVVSASERKCPMRAANTHLRDSARHFPD